MRRTSPAEVQPTLPTCRPHRPWHAVNRNPGTHRPCPPRSLVLADYFDVSWSPIRSALQRLDSEGLLEIMPKQGCFIRAIGIVKISHYYDVRVALEKAVVDEVLRLNPRAVVAALAEK